MLFVQYRNQDFWLKENAPLTLCNLASSFGALNVLKFWMAPTDCRNHICVQCHFVQQCCSPVALGECLASVSLDNDVASVHTVPKLCFHQSRGEGPLFGQMQI